MKDRPLHDARLSIHDKIDQDDFRKFVLNSAKSDRFVDLFRLLVQETLERDNKKAK